MRIQGGSSRPYRSAITRVSTRPWLALNNSGKQATCSASQAHSARSQVCRSQARPSTDILLQHFMAKVHDSYTPAFESIQAEMTRARQEGTGFCDSDDPFFLALVQNRTDSCRKSWPCKELSRAHCWAEAQRPSSRNPHAFAEQSACPQQLATSLPASCAHTPPRRISALRELVGEDGLARCHLTRSQLVLPEIRTPGASPEGVRFNKFSQHPR